MRNRGLSLLSASLLILGLIPVYQCGQQNVTPTDTQTPSEISAERASASSAIAQAYDKAPEPVGSLAAIQKNVAYPEIARRAGIQGKVVLNALISEDGTVAEVKVLTPLGGGCDESATTAIRSVQWHPAEKAGKPVKTWIAIPVVFKLDDKTPTGPQPDIQ